MSFRVARQMPASERSTGAWPRMLKLSSEYCRNILKSLPTSPCLEIARTVTQPVHFSPIRQHYGSVGDNKPSGDT
jgi:hypothetical protein